MIMELYDQEEVMRSYIKSKEHDTKVETAKRLLTIGKLSFEEIAIGSGLSIEEVEELAGWVCQVKCVSFFVFYQRLYSTADFYRKIS